MGIFTTRCLVVGCTAAVIVGCATTDQIFDQGPDLVPEPRAGASGPNSFCRTTDNQNLTVRVRNQGNQPAFVNTTTTVKFFPEGVGTESATTPPLADGAPADVSVPIPAGCFVPDCRFIIEVDANEDVEELKHNASDTSHEDNNRETGICIG